MLAALLMLASITTGGQAADAGPPATARVCYDGRCIGEAYPRSPYIVFFRDDGGTTLEHDGRRLVAEFAQQHRWWPHLVPTICAAADDRAMRRRVALLRAQMRTQGYRRVKLRREGRDCAINGGSRRTTGLVAYQLEL